MEESCPHCGVSLPALRDAFCPECRGDLTEARSEALSPAAAEPGPDEISDPGDPGDLPEEVEADLKKYRKGMKSLGWGLIILGGLQAAIAALFLAMAILPLAVPPFIVAFMVAFVGALAVANIGMGIGLRRGAAWVNWVVGVMYFLVVIFSGLNAVLGATTRPVNPGTCGGFLLAVAIFAYAVKNLRLLKKIRDAGFEP